MFRNLTPAMSRTRRMTLRQIAFDIEGFPDEMRTDSKQLHSSTTDEPSNMIRGDGKGMFKAR